MSYPGPGSNLESHVAFNCHISLVSSNLLEFFSLSSSVMPLMLLKSTGQFFYKIALSVGWSLFSPD